MIPKAYIDQWRATAPWTADHQVEQDLVICRALVLLRCGHWAEAAAIHEQPLRWNPGDNRGVRFLLGE